MGFVESLFFAAPGIIGALFLLWAMHTDRREDRKRYDTYGTCGCILTDMEFARDDFYKWKLEMEYRIKINKLMKDGGL